MEQGSVVEDAIVLPDAKIGRERPSTPCRRGQVLLLPDGFVAGVDRSADEARFHVTPSGVVLVTPEMLGQQVHQYS